MHDGHPNRVVGWVPIGVGRAAASLTSEVLAPARTKTAAARANLASVMGPPLSSRGRAARAPSTKGRSGSPFRRRTTPVRPTPNGRRRVCAVRQARGPEASLKGGGGPCDDAARRNLGEIVTSVTGQGGALVRQTSVAAQGEDWQQEGDASRGGKHERVQILP
jgi:hypothetical protein